jgi:hypothetical protein
MDYTINEFMALLNYSKNLELFIAFGVSSGEFSFKDLTGLNKELVRAQSFINGRKKYKKNNY